VADAFAVLLDLIVRDLVITDAQKDVDLNATADEQAGSIEAEKRRIVTEAEDRARALYPAFRNGLTLAFLVGFDLAESRSEESEPGHYDYFISVNWDPLYRLAETAGVDLPAALARAATIPGG
jgi:hypothetical protein